MSPVASRQSIRFTGAALVAVALLSACEAQAPDATPSIQPVSSESAAANAEVTQVDLQMANTLIRGGAVVLDVRSPEDWRDGHLQSAHHVPVQELPAQPLEQLPEKDQHILVYCAVGGRASKAGKILAERGFTQVHVLRPGGYKELAAAGLPVASGP